MQIRPRPGKSPMTKDQAIKVLKSVVPARDLLRAVPAETRNVTTVYSGTYHKTINVTDTDVVIDAGERGFIPPVVSSIEPPDHSLVRSVRKQKPGMSDVPARILGSKLLIVSIIQGYMGIGIRVEREGKKLDFPGGTRQLGENPYQCLIREIKEELDYDLSSAPLLHLGKSASALDATGVADACSDVYMVSASLIPGHVLDAAKMKWIVLKDIFPLSQGRRNNLAEWIPRILRFVQRSYQSAAELLEAVKMNVVPIPRKEIETSEKGFQGWSECFVPMPGMGVEYHDPNRPGPRREIAKRVDHGLVPNFNGRNVVAAQIASRLPLDDDDQRCESMRMITPPQQSMAVSHMQGSSTTSSLADLAPVYKPMVRSLNPAPGVVFAPVPPPLSLHDLATRNYLQDNSIESSFYFICWRILVCNREGGLRTVDLYKDMRKSFGVDQLAGRVLDDVIRMGWFRKEPSGVSDHVVVMNFAWQYV